MGLRETLHLEHLRHILSFDKHISDYAVVDISSARDDVDWSATEPLFQPQPGCLATRLVQFRRVDVSESDALGPIVKGVTINHVDLPTVDYPLDAPEWCRGLSTKH